VANRPPTWAEAPASLSLREGETKRLPFAPSDPDGDEVQVKVSEGDGWTARVEGGELVILGRFDGADASTLVIDLDDGKGETAQLSVPLTVERMSWKSTTKLAASGIEAREHPALLLDEEGQRVLVLGGSGYNPYGTPLGDLHAVSLVDGAVTALTPQGEAPAPAASRRVARIPGQRAVYLFGGYGEQNASNNDLLHVDYSGENPVFTRLEQVSPPSARSLHLFAFDPQNSKFFVFGGIGTFTPLADLYAGTLEGSTVTWKKLKPTGPKPSARYGFFFSVDQKQGTALVFSGAQGTSPLDPARDLWKLDLRADPPAWTKLLEGDAVPEGRRNGASAFDEERSLFYVWGGTPDAMNTAPGLWVYDGREGVGAWSEIKRPKAPSIRSSSAGFVTSDGTVRLGFGNTSSAIFSDLTPLGF